MIVILLPEQPKLCPCPLCTARRIDPDQEITDQMEQRLRSLVDHKDRP